MTEGLINEYYDQLMKSKMPHLVLGKIFKQIFGRELRRNEWSQLGKLTNLYGKWIVLESFIRSAVNPNFDNTNPWGYFNAVCLSVSKESRDSLENLEQVRQLQKATQDLVAELTKPHGKVKTKKKDF